ncbi:MAG: AMP-binding protein [Burkholderiales bacterium]|nr:AMP-binding protein [Burkholderiales bacterium]
MPRTTPWITTGTTPWPPELAERYRREGYWQGRPVTAWIAERVAERPDQVALVEGATRLSYRALWERAGAFAQYLLDHGLQPGDRVVLQLPNCWEFAAVTLGCLRVGVVPVMALPAHRQHELTHVAAKAGARALVITQQHRQDDLRAVARQVAGSVASVATILVRGEPDAVAGGARMLRLADAFTDSARLDDAAHAPIGADVALMLLSGGTTGAPKLIVRTHDDYACNIRWCNEIGGIDERTVYMVVIPAAHNFPLGCPGWLGTLFAGGRVVMSTPSAETALATMDAEQVTVTAVVPAVAQTWIEHQRAHGTLRGHSLKVLEVGGSRMPDELAPRVASVLGATLQQVFGMAEGLINMTRLDDPGEAIHHTQGRPVCPADEVRVVDAAGQDVPDGTPGALLTRGPYTPRGYFDEPEKNRQSFFDGWYASGDIVVRRADGNLIVAGRDKDMILRGGENISAEEVESLAYQVDGIEMAAAVAMPDPVLEERVCLYATLKSGCDVTLQDVVRSMRARGVAAFKIPERLEIVEQLPMTKVGKIDKKQLRDDIRRRMAGN